MNTGCYCKHLGLVFFVASAVYVISSLTELLYLTSIPGITELCKHFIVKFHNFWERPVLHVLCVGNTFL